MIGGNSLQNELSPYLIQHAGNPVHWKPWGAAAFEEARSRDLPIFLSVGYATCHWCHVMEHESFEDKATADYMNAHFVCVKVDREERPDVDSVYMTAVQMMTGQGGWPMSVFLTHEGQAFFGGTYWPKHRQYGRESFLDILQFITQTWTQRRPDVLKAAADLTTSLQPPHRPRQAHVDANSLLQAAFQEDDSRYDSLWGGFGSAPKFPMPHQLMRLIRHGHRTRNPDSIQMAVASLEAMARGGIRDHVGGGFHRYSVDRQWLVPHFEKMLYDQALLIMAFVEAHQATGRADLLQVGSETADYVLRDLTHPEGPFYCAEDADSCGEEGLFYTWTPDEIGQVLGPAAGAFMATYGVTPEGDLDGRSIPHLGKESPLSGPPSLAPMKQRLFDVRVRRTRPLLDDKVLSSWNGLMISALAKLGAVSGEQVYVQAACKAADFILGHMMPHGRLHRRWRKGHLIQQGFLEDQAAVSQGLLDLYESTGKAAYLETSLHLLRQTRTLFHDKNQGNYFLSGVDSEVLVVRQKDTADGALPSGNSLMALALLRAGHLTHSEDLLEQGREILECSMGAMRDHPSAFAWLMMALEFDRNPRTEIEISAPTDPASWEAVTAAHTGFIPGRLVMHTAPVPGQSISVRICHNQSCDLPVHDVLAVKTRLGAIQALMGVM